MTPAEFLAFWFAGCVGDIHLAAIDPEGKFKLISTSFSQPYDFQGMEDWARLYNKLGRNVYFETCTHRPGSPSRGKEESAYEMPGLFGEVDDYKDVKRDAVDAHLVDISADDRTSCVVETGEPNNGGYHIYAKFGSPVHLTSESAPTLKATNYAFGKWLLAAGRVERFDFASLLRLPGFRNYPDPAKREKYGRHEDDVLVLSTNDQTFAPDDFADLRTKFPYAERKAEVIIDAEPAAELPPDWGDHLDKPWLLNLWAALDEEDASKANYRIACYLEESTTYSDPEKIAVLAAHYVDGLGNPKKFPTAECVRKARLALKAARAELGKQGQDKPTQPTIQVNNRQFADVAKYAWAAVQGANDPPTLFLRDGRLVGVKTVDGAPRIGELSEDAMYGRLARVARWVKVTKTTTNTFLPKQVAKDMLADPDPNLPLLHAVIETPIFGRGGHLLATPCYHREDALWLNVPASLATCCPPPSPTAAEVAAARALLLDDLLVDFQFATEADRAHAVAAILLQFVRRMIDGCTPLHLIEAASPGTGKGLLADLINLLSTGQCCAPTTLPREEAEVRKKITSILMTAPPTILLDNVGHCLDSADLASALTADPWQDRALGTNRMVRVPNKATWLLTANNPDTTLEIARRIVRIRIEADTDRPWLLDDFKHDPLRTWVRENRAPLVRAVLLLIQAWVAAGRPAGNRVLGSFEEWGKVIGGILEVAGIPGFLGNLDELYDEADEEGRQWRAFCRIWWDDHAARWVSAGELRQLAEENQLLGDVLGDKGERSANIRLGKALHDRRGRHFGPWQIVIHDKDPSHAWYRLARHDAETTDSTSDGTGTAVGAGPEAAQGHDDAVGATEHAPDVARTSGPHRDPHREEKSTSALDFSDLPDVSRCFSSSRDQGAEGQSLPL